MRFHGLNVIDYSSLTVSSQTTPVTLASASPAMDVTKGTVGGKTVRRALMTLEDASIRWRADGSAASSTEGHEMAKTDILSLTDANYEELLKNIQFIAISSTTAYVRITFFD